ncbi:MAG: XRE family transcriptional regulator [Bacilli bacterium]
MRTRKQELVSDDLKPFVCSIIKEYREKYNYSLEDLARALNYKKNRQTLHKYETGTLNIPYEIFFDIANIFNINSDIFDEIPMTKGEKEIFEKKMIRSYVNTMNGNNNITSRGEKIVNTYRNASYEPISKMCDLSIKLLDDSMAPIYLKGDRVFFSKKDSYNNGDDIVIAVKGNILSVRRLYKSQKAIILQAMNPKYQTIVVNIFSEDMILGKVETLSREIK